MKFTEWPSGVVRFQLCPFRRTGLVSTIPAGKADILLALNGRKDCWLRFLNPRKGTFICDTQQIVPPFACRNRKMGVEQTYAGNPIGIFERVPNGYAIDASRMAEELGNIRVANTLLLGLLSTALEFSREEWQSVITEFVPPKTRELNRQAFLLGRNWVEKAIQEPGLPSEENTEKVFFDPQVRPRIELEITESWCKGCDICVKMCPERCLRLNEGLVAELSDPEACRAAGSANGSARILRSSFTFILFRETVEMSGSFSLQSLQGNMPVRSGDPGGVPFFAGYPITPSSEIAERMALELPKVEGYFIQMEDELASMGAILGASMGGTKAMTATSGPGFSLKQENLGYASAVEIPCVVVNVMRGGPSTGMPTRPAQADLMQARRGSHGTTL